MLSAKSFPAVSRSVLCLALAMTVTHVRGDVIELLSGAKVEGTVSGIDKAAREVTFTRMLASRPYERVYSYDKIHAVTMGGKRYVLNPMPADGASPTPRSGTGTTATEARGASSKAEIEDLIDQKGRTQPAWFEATNLNYPQTLDLSWPEKPSGPWNPQKNIGQFVWDIINPNPGRWREGIRFMHFLLQTHQEDPRLRTKIMNSIARMYYDFEQDYARAAFWWRQAGLEQNTQNPQAIKLASCYWKLGSKQMAVDLLRRTPAYSNSIKLWADMGDTDRALQLAESFARSGYGDMAYLYAGDACRIQGRYADALKYYEQTLETPATGKAKGRIEKNHARARANIDGIRIFDSLDLRRVADGTYEGQSLGYAGDVFIEVVVAGGRIESVRVTKHKEKQFYSAISDTPKQIVAKQGVTGIDAVSGATITSEAIINATARALAKDAR